jgi:predicted anti-sigma-YlaC factor YlaD
MSLLLDRLLSAEEALDLQTHIAECEDCRQMWEAMCCISTQFRAEPMAGPSPDFALRVGLRIQERDARRRRLHSSLRVALGSLVLWATMALSILVLILALWQPSFRILLLDGALPLLKNIIATIVVLGKALTSVAHALVERATSPAVLVSVMLAVAVAFVWTRVVFLHWGTVPDSI